MIKRTTAVVLCMFAAILMLCSCGGEDSFTDGKINIVCTVFPQYDMLRNIIKGSDSINPVLLLDKPTDPHSYQPVASDVITLGFCDAVIYTGGDSDVWVEDILNASENTATVKCSLMKELGEPELYCISHEHSHSEEEHHGHSHDEHIWLSPKKAIKLCDIITRLIISLDVENKALYEENARVYKEELTELDREYEKVISERKRDTLLFADRFPFLYLTEDYSLSYAAAYTGCSAESEVSAATVIDLISAVDTLSLPVILITETGTDELAITVKENSAEKNQEILVINSVQSVKDPENASYIKIMKDNLIVLGKALG